MNLQDPTPAVTPSDAALPGRLRLAIVRTARRLRQEAGTGLSPSLTAALATIEGCGPLTPSELAEREAIKRPAATRIVARLEAEGLVDRATDPTDGRVTLIAVTPAGRELLRRVRRRKNEYLARRLRDLPAADLAALERAADVLERLLESDRPRGRS
jgi:DNA-binding MarR family transcriptional regulator